MYLELESVGHGDEVIACGVGKKEQPDRSSGFWFEQLRRSCCSCMNVVEESSRKQFGAN